MATRTKGMASAVEVPGWVRARRWRGLVGGLLLVPCVLGAGEPPAATAPDYSCGVEASADAGPDVSIGSMGRGATLTCGDVGAVVEILVVYTAEANEAYGGIEATLALAGRMIRHSNVAYEKSGLKTRLRLVHVAEIEYTEEDGGSVLGRLANPDDGFLDDAHTLRDLHGADLVCLLVHRLSGAGGFAQYVGAFSVVRIPDNFPTIEGVFTHEVGHNYGCDHHHPGAGEVLTGGGGQVLSYSRGHRFLVGELQYRTIMAKGPEWETIGQFSNPDLTFEGVPTGVPAGQPGEADNARTIRERQWTLAAFRESLQDCDLDGTPDECAFESGEALDCNQNGVPDACDLLSASSEDTDGDGVPDECAVDCNENGVPDHHEIATAEAQDCNDNGIPDECDLLSTDFHLAGPAVVEPESEPLADPTYHAVTAADLDGDSAPDLAVVFDGDPEIRLLWNNGSAVFEAQTTISDAALPRVLTTADVDGNGSDDLVVVHASGDSLTVFWNRGDRVFEAGPTSDATVSTVVRSGRLDGDEHLDLVTGRQVLLGDGEGGFTAGVSVGDLVDVLPIDVDGDGDLDLAALPWASNVVEVSVNQGDATFASPQTIPVGECPRSVSAGDLDGDGRLDLVVANRCTDDISVLPGEQDGTFGAATQYVAGNGTIAGAVVDLDGDRQLDYLAVNRNARDLSVFLNEGDGSLGDAQRVAGLGVVGKPFALAAADLDGDGDPDLALVNEDTRELWLYINTRKLPFSDDTNTNDVPDECEVDLMLPGDCNADGEVDLSDAVCLLEYLFVRADSSLPCGLGTSSDEANVRLLDSNGDLVLDITDAVVLLTWKFLGGPAHVLGTACRLVAGCPSTCEG